MSSNKQQQPLTRGEIAERAGIGFETVRYYEERGLIPEPPRSSAGYRLYDESYVRRLRFIGRAQELGFTLSEIQELLELRGGAETTCSDVKNMADEKRESVEAKMRDLKRIHDALARLSKACEGGMAPTSECPVLDAMDNGSDLQKSCS